MKERIMPFDIEKAKEGAKVITRDGKLVKVLTCEAKMDTPIVVLVNRYDRNIYMLITLMVTSIVL